MTGPLLIDCLSDLHGTYPSLPGGDILLLGGDYTASNKPDQWIDFFQWLKRAPYDEIVLIAGNHDGLLHVLMTKESVEEIGQLAGIHYLCDSMVEINGIEIWGSPWTPLFDRVNPKCTAFMKPDEELEEYFEMIPKGLDILLTHGPAWATLDANRKGERCGSHALNKHLARAMPKVHICGHIHEQGGKRMPIQYENEGAPISCINVSCVDEKYIPRRGCIRIKILD